MNFFRGLLDLIQSMQKLGGKTDSTGNAGESGEKTLPTLKDILSAIRSLRSSPPRESRPPLPTLPKMLPITPQVKNEQGQSPFETVQPPPKYPAPTAESADRIRSKVDEAGRVADSINAQPATPTPSAFADALANLKNNPPKDLQPLNPPPPVPKGIYQPPPKPQAFPPAPMNFSPPPPVNVQPPQVTVSTPGQPAPQQADTGKLAALLASFVDGLRSLVANVKGTGQSQQPQQATGNRPPLLPAPTQPRPPLPEMPKAIQPSKPTSGKRGEDFLPGQPKAKGGVFSKMKGFLDGKAQAGGMTGKAAGAASGAMGGMAGMAAKLAGPVGMVIALGTAAAATAKAIFSFADGVNESNRELAKYNGQMANAFAQLDIRNLQRQMRLSQNTGGTGSELAEEMNRFGEDMQGIRETLQTFKNTIGFAGIRALRVGWKLLENSNAVIPVLRRIAALLENEARTGDQVPPEVQAIREIATGQWRNEGQQGMFQDF